MAPNVEIERKFLILKRPDQKPDKIQFIRQGYIAREGSNSVRIRELDGRYILSIKTAKIGDGRYELEYDVEQEEGEVLFSSLNHHPIIKKRELYTIGNHVWELDIFEGANKGLFVAEVELTSLRENVTIPEWVGPEVTELSKFYNANLAVRPFENWRIGYTALVSRMSDK